MAMVLHGTGNTHPGRSQSELDKLFAHLSRLNGVETGNSSILELKRKIEDRIAELIEAEMDQLNPSKKELGEVGKKIIAGALQSLSTSSLHEPIQLIGKHIDLAPVETHVVDPQNHVKVEHLEAMSHLAQIMPPDTTVTIQAAQSKK